MQYTQVDPFIDKISCMVCFYHIGREYKHYKLIKYK